MVGITAFKICEWLGIDIHDEVIPVTYEATDVSGTSAWLKEGDELKLIDLLHGLLLPSGNDAGFQIAEYLGDQLVERN